MNKDIITSFIIRTFAILLVQVYEHDMLVARLDEHLKTKKEFLERIDDKINDIKKVKWYTSFEKNNQECKIKVLGELKSEVSK